MEEQLTLEKLGGHKYRIHQQWDGTDEMLELLKEKDFQASLEGGMDYYLEIEEYEEHFNFGISMCECFQEMIGNYRFIMDYYHALARNNKDVEFGKQLADTADRIDLLLGIVELLGIENALYLLAKNYTKSLVEQAQRIYQESDESGFVDWLKENVEPRVFLNTEEMLRYLVIPRDIFEGYNAPYAFYISWRFVKNNMSGFVDWQLRNEIATKNPAEVFAYSLLNRSDEDAKMYVLYYWCSRNPIACHLFAMLNSQDVSFGVKGLIRKVLTENGNKDEEFASQLQHLYDEYKAVNGWIGIDFIQQVFENDSFKFPIDDVKYHLDEDIVDEDQSGFIGEIINERNDTDNLAKIFSYLVEFHYVSPKELDTTIYRFTGKRKPQGDSLLETVVWKGKPNDALYICKEFYNGKYDKMLRFFDVKVEGIAQKNYSSYADRPSKGIRDFFNGLFLVKPK